MSAPTMNATYPETWDEYVGQDEAKRQLRLKAMAAKKRGKNLSHILLKSQYAGIGKTALALLVAQEMDTLMLVVTGAMTIAQVQMMFLRLKDGDILFIDEIHKIMDSGKANAEWLLHYLQDGILLTPLGPEVVPQVTVIGATTDAGRLPDPIRQRFMIQPKLVRYTDAEAARIAAMMSRKILLPEGLPTLSDDVAMQVAVAASNRPRVINALLETLRDLAVIGEIPSPADGNYPMQDALEFAGLTPDGLTAEAVNYLRVLFVEFRCEPAGERPLRERMGEVGRGLAEIEHLLVDKDMIAKTKSGRMLTAAGKQRAKALFGALG